MSLNILTHESMHVRGELNESITECQSVQRNYQPVRLFGISHDVAKKAARDYYEKSYKLRAGGQGFNATYFSSQCAPGKVLDEKRDDAFWDAL